MDGKQLMRAIWSAEKGGCGEQAAGELSCVARARFPVLHSEKQWNCKNWLCWALEIEGGPLEINLVTQVLRTGAQIGWVGALNKVNGSGSLWGD